MQPYAGSYNPDDSYPPPPTLIGPSSLLQQATTWDPLGTGSTVKLEQGDYDFQPSSEANNASQEQLQSDAGKNKQAGRRGRLSCAECRRLKLKCSRTWPCTACVRRDCAVLCPDGCQRTETKGSRQREILTLLTRIQDLERALAAERAAKGLPDVEPAAEPSAPVDAIGLLSVSGDERSRYLGPSSASAHIDRIDDGHESDDLEASGEDSDFESPDTSPESRASFPFLSSGGTRLADYIGHLPNYTEAKRIADIYYDHIAFMYEPLQRDVFEKVHLPAIYTYRERTEKGAPGPALHPHRLAVVLAILSLGSLFDLKQPPRSPKAELYFTLAHSCLSSSRFLSVPTLAAVQTLHLICLYILNAHKNGGEQCWPLLGLAVRLGQAMGLHRDPGAWKLAQPEADQRRLLWAELVVLDGLQALTLGRPCATDERHRDTSLPSGEGLRWTKVADPCGNNDGERGTFHRAKWRLIPILSHIVERAFSCERANFDTILGLDRELRECMAAVPDELKYRELTKAQADGLSPQQLRRVMQSHALAVKMNETLLFLHRAYFVAALQTSPAEPLRSPYAASVIAICLEASKTLSDVARSAHALYSANASRQWSLCFHAYGGGVCVATLLLKSPGSLLARFAWKELERAVALLEMSESVVGVELLPRLRKLRENARQSLRAHAESSGAANKVSPLAFPQGGDPKANRAGADDDDDDFVSLGASSARPLLSRRVSAQGREGEPKERTPTQEDERPVPPVFDRPTSVDGIAPDVLQRIEALDSTVLAHVQIPSQHHQHHQQQQQQPPSTYVSSLPYISKIDPPPQPYAQAPPSAHPPLLRRPPNAIPTPPMSPSWPLEAHQVGWPSYLSATSAMPSYGSYTSFTPPLGPTALPSSTYAPSLGGTPLYSNHTYSAAFPPSFGSAPGGHSVTSSSPPYANADYGNYPTSSQPSASMSYGGPGGYPAYYSSTSYIQTPRLPPLPATSSASQSAFATSSLASVYGVVPPSAEAPPMASASAGMPGMQQSDDGRGDDWFGAPPGADGEGDLENEAMAGFGSERPYEDMLSYAFSGTPAY